MPEAIIEARTPADYGSFGALIVEYVQWCRARYREQAWLVEEVFSYQSLDGELQDLASAYGPPRGRTFLALRDAQVCGAGAYRRLADGSCEMKRLFVPDRCRGQGTGRRLCQALIEAARAEGFALMRLDTGTLFTEALGMYRGLGFQVCEPYYDYPPGILPHVVFMRLALSPD